MRSISVERLQSTISSKHRYSFSHISPCVNELKEKIDFKYFGCFRAFVVFDDVTKFSPIDPLFFLQREDDICSTPRNCKVKTYFIKLYSLKANYC